MSFLTARLPKDAFVLVKVGQTVAAGDTLAKTRNLERRSLPMAQLLKVQPRRVITHLIKKIGDVVEAGDIIAQKTSLFAKITLRSPLSGIIENFDEKKGMLYFKTSTENSVVKAKVSGRIIKINGSEELVIEFTGTVIEAEIGLGFPKEGLIHVLKTESPRLFELESELEGKIVAARIWTREALSKVKAIGIEAVLAQVPEGDEWSPLENFTFLLFSPANYAKVLKYEGIKAKAWGEEKVLVIGN